MTTTDPYGVEAYQAAGIPDAEIPEWQAARILAPRARGFRSAGVTPSEAVVLRNRGIVSAHGDRYRIALAELRREGGTPRLPQTAYRAATIDDAKDTASAALLAG